MSATMTKTSMPNDLAKAKLMQGERLANHRTINSGHTHRYDVMSGQRPGAVARIEVTDGEAKRYSLR